MSEYVYKNNRKLRCGYTTGSCATACAKAATMMLLSNREVEEVSIRTPKGMVLTLPIVKSMRTEEKVSCGVIKDSGDDADVTNGTTVYATVWKQSTTKKQRVIIEGGKGIGRVTKLGLDQPVGNAAINRVPRQMIEAAVWEVLEESECNDSIYVEISIPDGEELANRTFNPQLGIVGGLSILGTSGIVEPMSEKALVDTIRVEMNMRAKQGNHVVVVTPGNYGETYISQNLSHIIKDSVKSSNYIGETIDMGFEFSFEGMLFVSHIGKFVKLAAGIMNTHSRCADGRMDIMVHAALQAGADLPLLKRVSASVTTDDALFALKEGGFLENTMQVIMERIEQQLVRRANEYMTIGAIVFSNQLGYLGKTSKVDALLIRLEEQQ